VRPVHTFSVVPSLPQEIAGLLKVAYNLRWCWSHESVELFRQLLAQANIRDADATSKALDGIKRVLEGDIEGSVDPRFGGSVRKHTFVDGISDVDTLLILRDPTLKTKTPQKVLDYFERELRRELPE
jgi:Protein of unknown function (DUF3417)